MAFPLNPVNNQTYTTALGTTYQYFATDKAWKIVGSDLPGATGIQGITGLSGPTGQTGIQGTAGSQGVTGLVGAAGSNGSQGATGIVGLTGSTGIQGPGGTGTTNKLTMFTDGAAGVIGNSRVTQVSNGIAVNNDGFTEEGYISLANNETDKIWLTKKANTQHFAVALAAYGTDAITVDQTSGHMGLCTTSTVGVFNVAQDTSANAQKGLTYNVGPLQSGFTRDTSTQMVNLTDTGILAADATLSLGQFSSSYDVIMGHIDMHAANPATEGDSRHTHCTIRASEGLLIIVDDFGDTSFIGYTGSIIKIVGNDTGTRIDVCNCSGVNLRIAYDLHVAISQ